MATSDSEGGPTKYCNNCKRDIPEHNFEIHEIHCQRNVILCKTCEEPVPRSEMEEHTEEYHALVECRCKAKIEKSKFEKHENEECSHRMVQCQFCEVSLKLMDRFSHEDACGSRTEKCDKCGSYVMIRSAMDHDCSKVKITSNRISPYPVLPDIDYGFHSDFNGMNDNVNVDEFGLQSGFEGFPKEESSSKRSENSLANEPKIEKRRARRVPSNGQSASRGRPGNLGNGDHVAADLQELNLDGRNMRKRIGGTEDRQAKSDRHSRRSKARNLPNEIKKNTMRDNRTEDIPNLDVRGHGSQQNLLARGSRFPAMNFARSEIVSDGGQRRGVATYVKRENRVSASSGSRHSTVPERKEPRRRANVPRAIRIIGEDDPEEILTTDVPRNNLDLTEDSKTKKDEKLDIVDEGFQLPCEICDSLVPSYDLEMHQELCLMEQQKALRNFDRQIPEVVDDSPKVEPIVVDDFKNENDDEPSIPCEFCEERFPANSVILHQPYCDKNPERFQIDDAISHGNANDIISSRAGDTMGYWESRLNQNRHFNDDFFNQSPFQTMNSPTRDVAMNMGTRYPNQGTVSRFPGNVESDEDDVMAEDSVVIEDADQLSSSQTQRNWPYGKL